MEPDPGTDNGWFHVDDKIRAPLHSFNQKGQPDGVLDASVVDCIINHVHLFVLDMTVYIYAGGRYQADPHGSQTKELIRSLLFPKMMKSTIINRIYQQLLDRVHLHRTSDQLNLQPRHWINFQNGFYDVLEQKWIDHDPGYFCMNQIPFRYDPAWKPPDNPDISTTVGRFLQASIPDEDDRRMLWEFTGYAMTTDTGFQKFLTLTGTGGTGKSVVIGMMEDIVGRENISNISLQDLNNRFYPAALHLKLLNTCADIPSLGMQNIDNLKKATGEDSLIYERKGKDVGFFHSYAKLGFSANEIPLNLDEKSDAFYRRILILCMEQKVAPEDRDPHLREKASLTEAVDMEILKRSPADRVKVPKKPEEHKLRPYVDSDQCADFLEAIRGHRLELPFMFAIFFGMRRSEILGLRWSAIRDGLIYVEHTVSKMKTTVAKNRAKTEAGYRSYPLTPEILERLGELKSKQEKNRRVFGSCYHESDYVFTWEDGHPYSTDYLTKQFKKVVRASDRLSSDLTLHSLRASCVSILVHSGVDIKDIQTWVGHRDIHTTMNIYASTTQRKQAVVAAKMSDTIFGGKPA